MKFEQDRSVQADTLPLPESPAEVESDQTEAEDLSISCLEDKSETNTEQIMTQAVADMVNEMKMLQIENGK